MLYLTLYLIVAPSDYYIFIHELRDCKVYLSKSIVVRLHCISSYIELTSAFLLSAATVIVPYLPIIILATSRISICIQPSTAICPTNYYTVSTVHDYACTCMR